MEISTQLLEAAYRLRGNDVSPFVDWLRAERAEKLEYVAVAKLDVVPSLQGELRALTRILNLVDSAQAELAMKAGHKP